MWVKTIVNLDLQNSWFHFLPVPLTAARLNGLGVWFSLWVREVPGSNPGWALIFVLSAKGNFRGHTDLNHGPIGLQPIALPLSYIPLSRNILRCLTDFCWDWLIKLLPQVLKKAPPCVSVEVQNMPWPGFEPGLLRPQRRVLTTRRSRQLVSTRRHMAYEGQKSAPPWKSRKRYATLTRLATDCKEFSWCSGYHICLTHRRSPVWSRAKT